MAALESQSYLDDFLVSLDVTKYAAVYVSYGSRNIRDTEENQYTFYQSNPFFLKNFGPYLCIAIDPMFKGYNYTDHPTFRFATIPLEEMKDKEAIELSDQTKESPDKTTHKNYTFFKLSFSIKKVEEVTRKIVQLLDVKQRVFFVNFIKFVNPDAHDAAMGKYVNIEKYLGPFTKDYYDWGGYIYPNVIIKKNSTKIKTTMGDLDVSSLLSSTKIYNSFQEKDPSTILQRMYDDISSKKGKFKNVIDEIDAQKALLQCVIDITGKSERSDLQVEILSEPGPDEPSSKTSESKGASEGGKRTKRKRKQKRTKRNLNSRRK
jgi:hypothetical protein